MEDPRELLFRWVVSISITTLKIKAVKNLKIHKVTKNNNHKPLQGKHNTF